MMIRKKEGFTIIEIVFATLIFAIALLGLAAALSGSLHIIAELKKGSVASRILQTQIERLKGGAEIEDTSAVIRSGIEYTISTVLIDPPPEVGLIHAKVTVEWDSRAGQTCSRELNTYFYQNWEY